MGLRNTLYHFQTSLISIALYNHCPVESVLVKNLGNEQTLWKLHFLEYNSTFAVPKKLSWCLCYHNGFNLSDIKKQQFSMERKSQVVSGVVCNLTKIFTLVSLLAFLLFYSHEKMSIVSILCCLLELSVLPMVTQEQNWSFLSDLKCRLQFA